MYSLLYVDDEPDLRNLGRIYLEKGGDYFVTTTSSAEEGLEKLSSTTFDAIISDYQMPDMDGIEFLKQVRHVHGDIPFILFTGRGREEVVIEAINNGVDFYVQKGGAAVAQFAELRHKISIALERRHVAGALKSENEKNKSLMDAASDAIFIVDIASRLIIDANRKALKITGMSIEEIRSAPYMIIHPYEYHDQYRVLFDQMISEGSGSATLMVRDKEGRQVPMIASATVIDINAKPCIMGIFHDISDIQRSQVALQLANRKLNLLAEITRHDIRNKLTVVGGYLDLVRSRPPEPDYSMYYKKIRSMIKEIGQNIEFTRIYQDLGTTAPDWKNVHEVFFRACTHIDIVSINVQSDTRDIEVFADPLLERAFYNFVENSLAHGGGVSVIRISVRDSPDGSAIVSIEDNGAGVPPFEKEKIFSKGYGKNTGFGLFLVREILSITGIEVRETGEYHKGARFELIVPLGAYRYPRHPQGERCHIMTPAPDNP